MTTKTKISQKGLNNDLGIQTSNIENLEKGFSFTVKTELDAYKAAYKLRIHETVVQAPKEKKGWSVEVYIK